MVLRLCRSVTQPRNVQKKYTLTSHWYYHKICVCNKAHIYETFTYLDALYAQKHIARVATAAAQASEWSYMTSIWMHYMRKNTLHVWLLLPLRPVSEVIWLAVVSKAKKYCKLSLSICSVMQILDILCISAGFMVLTFHYEQVVCIF